MSNTNASIDQDDIAARLRTLLDTRGPSSILRYHYAGTMGLMENSHAHALWRALGTPELDETICATAGRLTSSPASSAPASCRRPRGSRS